MKKIENIRVEKNGDRFVVSCRDAEARYHYWTIDGVNLAPTGEVLFKNPPNGTGTMDAGYFTTRKLKIAKNKTMVEAMRATGVLQIAAAVQAEKEREAKRIEDGRARSRDHMLEIVRAYAAYQIGVPLDKITDDDLTAAVKQMVEKFNPEKERT